MASRELAVFCKELKDLICAKSTLSLFTLSSFLLGFGFIQAVDLFSEASRAALEHRELAPGMNPFEGVIVPTLGSLYLISTLLFPFVAIRAISGEKESGSLKLLLQLPLSFSRVFILKAVAVFLCWLIAITPALLAIFLWWIKGGHVDTGELIVVFFGHALYAFAITGLAFLIASLTNSGASAALFVLGVTLGSWVLDFALSSHSITWIRNLSFLSLTADIRPFERGLLLSESVLRFLIVGVASAGAAYFILSRPAATRREKTVFAAGLLFVSLLCGLASSQWKFHSDLSEDRRNSFSPEQEVTLKSIRGNLQIQVALSPDDPRYKDLQRNVLSKLQRTMPSLSVSFDSTGKSNLFGVGSEERYGLNNYLYEGKSETSRSTSPRELLPLIYRLAGREAPGENSSSYPGYPFVADMTFFGILFYLVLPFLFLLLWWKHYRVRKPYGGKPT